MARPGTLDWKLKWEKKKKFYTWLSEAALNKLDRTQTDGPGSWGAVDEQQHHGTC